MLSSFGAKDKRLTQVQYPGMDAQYKYDALGRRIEKNVNGQVTTYVYDGLIWL